MICIWVILYVKTDTYVFVAVMNNSIAIYMAYVQWLSSSSSEQEPEPEPVQL